MPTVKKTLPEIVVLISGSGSNLQAIIDQIENNTLNARIAAVISNKPNVKGLKRAQRSGIPAHVLDHTEFAGREAYDQALQTLIDEFNPALIVLAGFMRILSEDFVQRYQGKMLNIHPSLLPKHKGLHTHARAIEAGDKEHGCTVHFVTPELDGGPIIAHRKVSIESHDTEETLAKRVQQQEHTLYPLCAKLFVDGRLALTQAGPTLDGISIIEGGLDLTGTDDL